MHRARRWTARLTLAAVAACAGEAVSGREGAGEEDGELATADQEDVAAAQDYLKRFGYFPDP